MATIARVTEIIASSPKSFDSAMAAVVKRANLEECVGCVDQRPIRQN